MSFLVTNTDGDIDSGITLNMINRKDNIKNFKKINSKIRVAKFNESMTAEGTGSVEFERCKLKVVYIPELSKKLLSVSAITSSDSKVLFEKEVIISYKNKTVLKGNKLKMVYFKLG